MCARASRTLPRKRDMIPQPTPSSAVSAGGVGVPGSSASDLSLQQQITEMDVDIEDSLVVDQEAPMEKTDADFFNGVCSALRACLLALQV